LSPGDWEDHIQEGSAEEERIPKQKRREISGTFIRQTCQDHTKPISILNQHSDRDASVDIDSTQRDTELSENIARR
jgi:hypothetical protein